MRRFEFHWRPLIYLPFYRNNLNIRTTYVYEIQAYMQRSNDRQLQEYYVEFLTRRIFHNIVLHVFAVHVREYEGLEPVKSLTILLKIIYQKYIGRTNVLSQRNFTMILLKISVNASVQLSSCPLCRDFSVSHDGRLQSLICITFYFLIIACISHNMFCLSKKVTHCLSRTDFCIPICFTDQLSSRIP